MKDDFNLDENFDEELEKSIAMIVDEENTDANLYVKRNFAGSSDMPEIDSGTTSADTDDEEDEDDGYDEDNDDNQDDKTSPKKIVIIVAIVLVVVGLIGTGAFFLIRSAYNSSRDNYGYYNELGYKALDSKDYESAITNFEKALTYDEGKEATDTNLNMMLYLYECYDKTDKADKAKETLENVLSLDPDNENAVYYLIQIYDENKEYDSIIDLYDSLKDSQSEKIKSMFSRYVISEPQISPEGGDFSDDVRVTISGGIDTTVYYTIDGSEPSETSQIYSDKLEFTEGTTTVKYFSVNKYGFKSDVYEQTYVVEYSAPEIPKISPEDTEISQSGKVMVTISNIETGSKVYYTTDGSTPTQSSKLYDRTPFELPAGTTTVNVLVVNSHGKTATATKTYKVEYVANYTKDEAEELIWEMLESKKYVDKDHLNKDELECTMDYYAKKTIDGNTIYMFYYNIDGEKQDYWFGADSSYGTIFKITGDKDDYTLKVVK